MRFSTALALATAQAFSSAVSAQTLYENVIVQDGTTDVSLPVPLQAVQGVEAGAPIKLGTELRILCIGDSITAGVGSSDKNGYREDLRSNLAGDTVVFAGTEKSGTMDDGYQAGWPGKTIQFMSSRVGPSLSQRPNIVLIHAGTNDMNPNPAISTEGSDPQQASERLGLLIDQVLEACPDAVVLVAVIVNTCSSAQRANVEQFQRLVPGVARSRLAAGRRVLAVDFAALGDGVLGGDCVHPDDAGYRVMADGWYNALTQVPKSWITGPVGRDPVRSEVAGTAVDASADAAEGEGEDKDSAAWGGRAAAPFWIPTAVMMVWLAMQA